jgi:hypothetical protein
MTTQEQLRQAILDNDIVLSAVLFGKLPRAPKSLQEVCDIKQLLIWALQMMRVNRAHDAARLAELIRSSLYPPRRSETHSTWQLSA